MGKRNCHCWPLENMPTLDALKVYDYCQLPMNPLKGMDGQ